MKRENIIRLAGLISIIIGTIAGFYLGQDSGARQMARHILNPQFRTDSFDSKVSEEKGVCTDLVDCIKSNFSVDTITEEFLIDLCDSQDVDHRQPFSIACANCGSIHLVSYSWKKPDEMMGLVVNMTSTSEGVFCSPCGYQLGTDWKVYGLDVPDWHESIELKK